MTNLRDWQKRKFDFWDWWNIFWGAAFLFIISAKMMGFLPDCLLCEMFGRLN